MSQLAKLAKPFPAAYIEKPPKGKYGEFVAHHTINQALLATVGPFDLEVVQILYGDMPARMDKDTGKVKKEALHHIVVGAVVALTLTIDGRRTRIEEAGDCEDPHNWPTDGARLKDCMSDGIKRAAMRAGCGLHLWSQEHYFLDKSLASKDATNTPQNGGVDAGSAKGDAGQDSSQSSRDGADSHDVGRAPVEPPTTATPETERAGGNAPAPSSKSQPIVCARCGTDLGSTFHAEVDGHFVCVSCADDLQPHAVEPSPAQGAEPAGSEGRPDLVRPSQRTTETAPQSLRSDEQSRTLWAQAKRVWGPNHADELRRKMASLEFGAKTSTKELTASEASRLIEDLLGLADWKPRRLEA